MKKILLLLILVLPFSMNLALQAQNEGEKLFKSVCAACHTINKGRLIGPDLSGVYLKRDKEWLVDFIRSSQKLIKSGDTAAMAIYNEYNKIPMPDNQLSDEQILSLIEYIKSFDTETSVSAVKSTIPTDSTGMQFSPETILEGRDLFNGYKPFANGASPCIACHNINDQSMLGGGKLAIDLTDSYTKLGPAGITAILTNPPFPVMKSSLLNHALKEDEIQAVISLLKSAGERNSAYKSRESGGIIFFTLGFVCALFLFVNIYIIYDNRKISEFNRVPNK